MESRTRFLCALAALATGAALGLPQNAAAGPDPVNQPLADGCQRNPAGLLTYTSPEWVFVNSRAGGDHVRTVEGSASLVHTADEDLPEGHLSYDLDWDVAPDAAYTGLLAGDPNANGGQGNGNYAHDADFAKLHVEWESGSVPAYVWPTERDRVKLWGQWIWDCGHWGQGVDTDPGHRQDALIGTGDYFLPGQVEGGAPANLRGEQTELHPMQAIVVNRAAPNRAAAAETQTDMFVSSDGTHALGEEQCAARSALAGQPISGPDFTACVNGGGNERQAVNGRAYDFFVPAPPRPSPDARLRVREEGRVAGRGASEQITPTANGILVHVAFDQVAPGDAGPLAFGRSYFVGWDRGSAPAPDHLLLTLKSVTVNHSLDPNPDRPQSTGAPPGEYNLYLNANGVWNFIGGHGLTAPAGEWAPGLGAVTDGQRIDINRGLDFFVPHGQPVRLDVSGRECDLPRMDPCVVNGEVSDGNDHPGEAIATFASADAALGDHTLRSPVNDNYELAYSIRRTTGTAGAGCGSTGVGSSSGGGSLGGAGAVLCPASPACYDTRAPRSRVLRRASARGASRRRIAVRGAASDVACGRAARVRRVEVALARVEGPRRHQRCRFLKRDGRLTARTSCRRRVYLRASGTRRWRFSRRRRFAGGSYRVWVRAVDRAGNIELRSGRANTLGFRVR
ncbi:MAG TPA: hypothetical protein VGN71_03515 [Solirubrobacteraceae bacterium]|jgi:uncharacterized membrane protein YgcG|nr:hypothetical protein [Solirubrobacteraceae bacterium]